METKMFSKNKKVKNMTQYDLNFMQYAQRISKAVRMIKNISQISESIIKNGHNLHIQISHIN